MSGGIEIAAGSFADLDSVMAVMEDGFDPAFGEAWTRAQCASLLPMPGVWLTLARDGGEVVGFAMSRTVAGEAELLLLAVARGARRRGAGAKLVRRFLEDAAARGAGKMHLEVRDGNPAIGLYSSAGFSEVGRRKDYYRGPSGEQYDALTLARSAPV